MAFFLSCSPDNALPTAKTPATRTLVDCTMFSSVAIRHAAFSSSCWIAVALASLGHVDAGSGSLRSAYLGSQVWDKDLSLQQVTDQLHEHFAQVLSILERNRNVGLRVALKRAEASSLRPWTQVERRQVLASLARRRDLQIKRLRDYARRGRFPTNEGQSEASTPIFVDRSETLCAVGYLMHSDGCDDLVAEIVAANNLVQVNKVNSGGLVRWVLTSGLIQEEAALIQPGYPIPLDAAMWDFLAAGEVVDKFPLTLSGLTYRRVELDIDSSTNLPTSEVIELAWQQGKNELQDAPPIGFLSAGAYIGAGDLGFGEEGYGGTSPTRLDRWIYVGPDDSIFGTLLGGRERPFSDGYAQMIEVEYLLQLQAGKFSDFGFTYRPSYLNEGVEQGSIRLASQIYDASTDQLVSEVIHEDTANGFGISDIRSQIDRFTGDAIRVKMYGLTLAEDASGNEPEVHSIFFEFGVSTVPEPGTLSILLLAIGIVSGRRRAPAMTGRCARSLGAGCPAN